MEVLIAGGGIGGLTAAVHLAQAGFQVRVFEQAAELSEVGAGIQMSANAGHSLAAIGLEDGMRQIGCEPEVWRMRLHDTGEVAGEVPLGAHHARLHGQPYRLVHRARLQALLANRLDVLAPGALSLGRQVASFEDSPGGVTLALADGETVRGDLLVIADGIKSRLRVSIAGEQTPRYTGFAAWRAMVPATRVSPGLCDGYIDLFMGPGQHCVMYRVKAPDGTDLINFVALANRAEPTEETWTTARPLAEFKRDYEGWHEDFTQLIDAIEGDKALLWALFVREVLPRWRSARAILIGDAAHPTMPNIAQGAAMAIEDAAVLARAMVASDDINAALDTFERLRIPRTTRIVNTAAAILDAFHGDDPDAIRAELRSGQAALAERDQWLYNYNPMTVPLTADAALQ